MYRRPKFLEILLEIRQDMAHEADYDVDLFAERVRAGITPARDETNILSTKGDTSVANAEEQASRREPEKISDTITGR